LRHVKLIITKISVTTILTQNIIFSFASTVFNFVVIT